jgi:hypothetical protein
VSTETKARDAAIADRRATLEGEIVVRRTRLESARKKNIPDDPDWTDWITHLEAQVHEAETTLARFESVLQMRRVEDAWRALDKDFAIQSAHALVEAIRAAGGPHALRVWAKAGTGVRVYFPENIGYLDVGEDGSVSDVTRGRLHFQASGLFPAWARAVREGRRAYAAQLGERLAAHGEARATVAEKIRNP